MGSRLTDGLIALRRDYLDQLRPTMELIGHEWAGWCSGDRDAGLRLRREVHRLHGSGATFGFRNISRVAEELERLLDRALVAPELDVEEVDAIERGLERLATVAERIDQSGRVKPRSPSGDPAASPGSRG